MWRLTKLLKGGRWPTSTVYKGQRFRCMGTLPLTNRTSSQRLPYLRSALSTSTASVRTTAAVGSVYNVSRRTFMSSTSGLQTASVDWDSSDNLTGEEARCPGCGAPLQSTSPDMVGYVPQGKLNRPIEDKATSDDEELDEIIKKNTNKPIICHRCYNLKHYGKVLPTRIPKDDYKRHLQNLRKKRGLIVHVVDIFDFPGSLYKDIEEIIGNQNPILVVANKTDLLFRTATDKTALRKQLQQWFDQEIAQMNMTNYVGSALVSATVGIGMHQLRQKMEQFREGRDVYFVGCTNVGKSSIINRLLLEFRRDVSGPKMLKRLENDTTVSRWPGTTLSVASFPLILPSMRERSESGSVSPVKTDASPGAHGYIHDTPGIFNPDQLAHILTHEELKAVFPSKAPVPRTFILKPGQCIYLSGLARLDYLEGPHSAHFTVFASMAVNIHPTSVKRADQLWEEHAGKDALVFELPSVGEERMREFPPLNGKEYTVEGVGLNKGASDIVLSGVGWVSVAAGESAIVKLRALTPGGIGLVQRPCLIPDAVRLRGERVKSRGKRQQFKGKSVSR